MASLLRPTLKLSASFGVGGGYGLALAIAAAPGGGGAYAGAKTVSYAEAAAPYQMKYSTPNGTLSGGGAAAAYGASSSGRAQVNVTANPGGNHSGDLSYSWGGGGGLSYINATSQTITAYYDFTGVANGTTSAGQTNTGLFCDITDNKTGAVWRTNTITVGPLTWQNTIPAYTNMVLSVDSETPGYCEVGLAPGSCIATHFISMKVTGGTGSYTWLWEYISGDTSGVSHPATNTKDFYSSKTLFCGGAGPGENAGGVWRVTVSDGVGPSQSYDWGWGCDSFALND